MARLMRVTILTALAVGVTGGALGLAPAAGDESPHLHDADTVRGGWSPDVKAAKRFARGRTGGVRFAFIDPYGRWHSLNARNGAPMASLFKALLLATYLSQPNVRDRSLHGWERDLLNPMIKRSDNGSATRLRDMLGPGPIKNMARRANMDDFSYNSIWGLSRTSSRDQVRFFSHWDSFVPQRHEDYARYLLSHIVPSQRWGVGRVTPQGWRLYFKGGWGVGTGRVNHQTAFYEKGVCRATLSVMTEYSPDHHYGTETIKGIAERLINGINGVNCGRLTQGGRAYIRHQSR